MPQALRLGFLIDPLESLLPHHDTTFALMVEAHKRGHEVLVFEQEDLSYRAGRTHARMTRATFVHEPKLAAVRGDRRDEPVCSLDVVFMRKDPPADEEFMHATQLMELCGHPRPLMVNDPRGLRDANEKLFALLFPELTPITWVSRDVKVLRSFLDEVTPEAVLKPLDGFAGSGVVLLKKGDRNVASLLELHTGGGTRPALLQSYLNESREGDKRILMLDGEPIGAVLRVPPEDDVRANLAVGGRASATELTARDREICDRIAPVLRAHGLYFVGIDVIGDKLTEINVTSPTGLVEINQLHKVKLEEKVLSWVEKRVATRRERSAGQ